MTDNEDWLVADLRDQLRGQRRELRAAQIGVALLVLALALLVLRLFQLGVL